MVAQADPGQQFFHSFPDLGFRIDTRQFHGEGDVVGHGFGRQQVEVLEDHAHFAAESPELGGAVAGDVFVIDQDAAAGRWLEHIDQADKGRLARTGMADDAEYFAGFYGHTRSEERRVGKECRSWWWRYH